MKKSIIFYLIIFILPSLGWGQSITYPESRRLPHMDTYFGKTVADPYRWMENLDAGETQKWIANQTELKEKYREKLNKSNRIFHTLHDYAISYDYDFSQKINYNYNNNKYIIRLTYWAWNKPATLTYAKKGEELTTHLILDPQKISQSKDEVVSIENFILSPDEKYLTIFISRSGSDWKEICIYDFGQKKLLPEIIKNVKFSDIAWADDFAFYYVYQTPAANHLIDLDKERIIKFHHLNTDPETTALFIKICKKMVGNRLILQQTKVKSTYSSGMCSL